MYCLTVCGESDMDADWSSAKSSGFKESALLCKALGEAGCYERAKLITCAIRSAVVEVLARQWRTNDATLHTDTCKCPVRPSGGGKDEIPCPVPLRHIRTEAVRSGRYWKGWTVLAQGRPGS